MTDVGLDKETTSRRRGGEERRGVASGEKGCYKIDLEHEPRTS